MVIFSLTLYLFQDPSDPDKLILIGYVCIGMLAVFFITNWLIIFSSKFYDLCKFIYEKCRKKSEEELEMEEERKTVRHIKYNPEPPRKIKRYSDYHERGEPKEEEKKEERKMIIQKIYPKKGIRMNVHCGIVDTRRL